MNVPLDLIKALSIEDRFWPNVNHFCPTFKMKNWVKGRAGKTKRLQAFTAKNIFRRRKLLFHLLRFASQNVTFSYINKNLW
jgi:hypothetical protein